MKFHRLTALMPCRGLEELSLQRTADEAEQILSAWSALWHPALVATAQTMPHWAAAEEPPQDPSEHLILLPPCAEGLLPADWLVQAEQTGASVLRNLRHRDEMVTAALGRLEEAPPPADPALVADFLALGFCHFTIEMLTQHLRYMSNLDETSFERELVAAAEAACQGNAEAARGRLQAAFDLMHTAREYFYPVEAHLLDLTLVAPTTLGASLRACLEGSPPANLLISGEVLEEMAHREPESLAALRKALESGAAAIVGGEFRELELPLLPREAIRRQFEKGLASYQQHLGVRPAVFGRRRFGMTPVLQQILDQMGFTGVLHATLDDGRFPSDNQSRIRWEGIDATTMETILRVPADIGRADAFYRLPQHLGNSMDMDHVATAVFAHWPGRSSPWYQDLLRIARYTTVMGSFATITDYFQQTGTAGQQTAYKADEYRSPYLKQAVAAGRRDPISRWVRYYARRAAAEAVQTLSTLGALVLQDALAGDPGLLEDVDNTPATEGADDPALDARLQKGLRSAVEGFARCVSEADRSRRSGILLVNPWSFMRRLGLDVSELAALPDVEDPVQWAAESSGRKTAVVDVPPLGFAWIGPGGGVAPPAPPPRKWGIFRQRPAEPPPLAQLMAEGRDRGRSRRSSSGSPADSSAGTAREGAVMRNEFFELHVDPHTGAIRSVFDYQSRDPRLAQQIAMRGPGGSSDSDDAYSIMAADEVVVVSPGPVLGEVVARGRLLNRQGRRLAGFRQTTRIWRGSRVIELDIELDVDELPGANPWSSYYGARFAWSDESASLYRSVNQANLPTDATQFEAPHFVDIRLQQRRTTILSGGLPYHRRIGPRRLDTLLVVRGETARRFRLGIGIDVPHPMAAAIELLAPPAMEPGRSRPPHASGWLFHLDARGVITTHWEPVCGDGRVEGFRVRLLETDGRRVRPGLRVFRAVQSARKIAPGDRPPIDLPIEGDCVAVDLRPHEWAEVEGRF